MKKPQKSLYDWGKANYRTKSGKPSTQGPEATGERYLPEEAIEALTPEQYAQTTALKRKGIKQGKKKVMNPKKIRQIIKRYT